MFYECYSVLSESIKTDKTTPEIKYDSTFFDYLGSKPECLKDFMHGVSSYFKKISPELIPHINLQNSHKIISMGGHTGDLLCEIAKHNPNIQGVIFEPTLFRQTIDTKIQECNLSDRIKVQAGNYIDNVPQGFDTIICECVSKEHSDEEFDKILRNVRSSMNPDSKIYFIDLVMDRSHEEYEMARYMDILLLSLLNGKVRTREEMVPFFERNGLRVKNVTPMKLGALIEAEVV